MKKVEFYQAQESNIANSYGQKDANNQLIIKDGSKIQFSSREDAKKFSELISNLRNTEVDFKKKAIEVRPEKDLISDEISLTPNDILALDGLVKFVI